MPKRYASNGGGAFRGVFLQGNEAVVPIFEAWMKPFANVGMKTLTVRPTSGTHDDEPGFSSHALPDSSLYGQKKVGQDAFDTSVAGTATIRRSML
jgi:hypothetical protein